MLSSRWSTTGGLPPQKLSSLSRRLRGQEFAELPVETFEGVIWGFLIWQYDPYMMPTIYIYIIYRVCTYSHTYIYTCVYKHVHTYYNGVVSRLSGPGVWARLGVLGTQLQGEP